MLFEKFNELWFNPCYSSLWPDPVYYGHIHRMGPILNYAFLLSYFLRHESFMMMCLVALFPEKLQALVLISLLP